MFLGSAETFDNRKCVSFCIVSCLSIELFLASDLKLAPAGYKALFLQPEYIQTDHNVHQKKMNMTFILRNFIFIILGMDHLNNNHHLMTMRCLKTVCWHSAGCYSPTPQTSLQTSHQWLGRCWQWNPPPKRYNVLRHTTNTIQNGLWNITKSPGSWPGLQTPQNLNPIKHSLDAKEPMTEQRPHCWAYRNERTHIHQRRPRILSFTLLHSPDSYISHSGSFVHKIRTILMFPPQICTAFLL